MNPKIFPALLIVLDIAAAAVYLYHGDWRHVFYWMFAAGITAAATF
jgi:hypothetical protein